MEEAQRCETEFKTSEDPSGQEVGPKDLMGKDGGEKGRWGQL